MSCYRNGGCGAYENRSCGECPASKPEYAKRNFPTRKCEACNEVVFGVYALRHTTSNKPVEAQIDPMFCPSCGAQFNRM